ncbi:BgTH12-03020 [Blumeria graminis f. sp. triticale]|uniref:Bgt-4725 n=3 Tax=Blumeria graminis TaxID=34373 RepID=A0A381L5K3_BLUGR|nr:hypothetical protein BGT96224_4725 [Blumeria graminis f. sp. tritici 96224]CAD6503354.1 BgTH12-03020 [Blumeria graminis f. sp. triticale]VDB89394.1 Bgt-4725 [Blumeria graminis f. sp. tritici]
MPCIIALIISLDPVVPHFTGKKSWNVYNKANIETVRRDEAAAKAAEEAEEERMQALDAERNMQILRGETPTPLPEPVSSSTEKKYGRDRSEQRPHGRKLRKKAGENDTDFEIRLAREHVSGEDAQLVQRRSRTSGAEVQSNDSKVSEDLVSKGHSTHVRAGKNPEAEREAARKKREYEDQYTMRFSNAAGLKIDPNQAPWYSRSGDIEKHSDQAKSMDLWGNEDPRRKARELQRTIKDDPLALMKAGARQVRELQRDKRLRMKIDRNIREHKETRHPRPGDERMRRAISPRSDKHRRSGSKDVAKEHEKIDGVHDKLNRHGNIESRQRHRHSER